MRWLLLKDLQILRRSPLLVAMLVVYPAVIGLLIGFAISSPPGKPRVAIYTGVASGRSVVSFGGQRINVSRYARELYSAVTPPHTSSPAAAIADVRAGRALAAVIIPADTVTQIRNLIATGEGDPKIQVVLNDSNPLERDLVQQALQSRVAAVQQAVSKQVLSTVVGDLRLVLGGGHISFLGRSLQLLGLRDTRAIVAGAIAALPSGSPISPGLGQVVRFATIAIDGLSLVAPQITGLATPLTVTQTELSGRTTPTASYAVAIAAVVLLMFVTLLLAAGMLALERAENAQRRLLTLVRPGALLAEKVALAGGCALVLTLLGAAVISAFVTLDWGAFGLWALTLAAGGLAFAALGVAVGALARDVSVASLLAFLISLPVAFIALIPSTAVSSALWTVLSAVSFVFPFRAALEAVSGAFSGGGSGIPLALAHLLGLSVGFGLLARMALGRFAQS